MNSVTIDLENRKIKICSNVICEMKKYIQKGANSKEAGGILLGKENLSNENLIITNITLPMLKDKREYARFYRKDKGHVEFYNSLYKASHRTIRYIGEWHTHDEANPNFSSIDFKNWRKIKNEIKIQQDYCHIIIGFETLRVWIIKKEINEPKMIKTINWGDLNENIYV